jgi:sialic acid synthase SpsE
MKPRVLKKVREELQATRDSCLDGIDGSWEVNEEGFLAMAQGIEEVAKLLGIQLDDYQPEEDDE